MTQVAQICDSALCQWKLAHTPEHAACRVCRRPLSPQQMGTRLCSPDCLQTATAQHRELTQKRHQDLTDQGIVMRARGAATLGLVEEHTYPVTVVPAFTGRLTNLPERRKRAFRDHLSRLLSQVTAHRGRVAEEGSAATPTPVEPSSTPLTAVLGSVCANCQGACCQNGGNNAYLTVDVLRRYLDAHPRQRPREILAAYLEALGPRTYEHSCVFHQTSGCALPRDMRSDTCNDFFCAGLTAFQQNLPTPGPVRGFFLSVENGAVLTAAFIEEHANRRIPLALARTAS